MKKRLVPIIIIWISLLIILYKFGLTHNSLQEISNTIKNSQNSSHLMFLLVFISRILLFIPSSVFIVVGSLFFSPFENIMLSLTAMFIVESIIFFFGRNLKNTELHQKVTNKIPSTPDTICHNKHLVLFLTVASPMAPTDLACFIAATNMSYCKYISTVLLGNIPIIVLYTFFGKALLHSPVLTIGITLAFISIFCIVAILRKIVKRAQLANLEERHI